MKRILFILLYLLPLLMWAQSKSTASLSPAESKARLQQLGDSLRKYDYFENFDRLGWMVVGIRSNKSAKNQFPDRYGNTTFTEEEMRQIEQWHNEKLRSRK